MMACPSCKSSEGVQIEGDSTGSAQWAGRCEPCGHNWNFTDDF